MNPSTDAEGGLFAALKRTLALLLDHGKVRLELLANEFEEEKLRTLHLLLLVQGMVFFLALGVVVSVMFFAALFWESRLLVLGVFSLVFLGGGALFYGFFRLALRRRTGPFAASIAEFREDIEQLRAVTRHDPPA